MIIVEILRHNLSDNILNNYMFVFLISIRGTKSFVVNFGSFPQWVVLFVEVRPNLLSGESERFFLEDISQVLEVWNQGIMFSIFKINLCVS